MSAAIELSPELDAALRAQLREGEVVVYARQPLMQCDLRVWGGIWPFDAGTTLALATAILGGVGLVHWVIDKIRGTDRPMDGPLGFIFLAGFLFPGAAEVLRSIRARRVNRHTVYAVTNQRILKIAIWPRLEVDAWEASAVTEVSRRDIKPDCGNVRYLKGIFSHDGNALMFVPAPEACESAVRALLGVTTPKESQLA